MPKELELTKWQVHEAWLWGIFDANYGGVVYPTHTKLREAFELGRLCGSPNGTGGYRAVVTDKAGLLREIDDCRKGYPLKLAMAQKRYDDMERIRKAQWPSAVTHS